MTKIVFGHRRLPVAKFALAIVWLVAVAGRSLASENRIEENAALGITYDSNRLLVESPEKEIYGSRQRAGIMMSSDANRYRINSGVKVVDEYLPESRENEVDQLKFDLGGSIKSTKSLLNASLNVQSDSTLSADVQSSGFVNENKDRLRSVATVGYQYSLSEADVLSGNASYEKVDYEDILPGQLSEYGYAGLRGGYARSISSKDKLVLSLFGSELENEDVQTNTTTLGLSIGWSRLLSEAWSLDANFGRRKSEYVKDLGFTEFQNTNSSRVTDVKLKYAGQRWQYSMLGSYSVLPGNAGELVNRKSLDMSAWFPFSEVVGVSGQLLYWQQRSDLTVSPGSDLDTLQASLVLNWRVERALYLIASVNRIERRMLFEDDSVYSNGIVFEMVWASNPLFL